MQGAPTIELRRRGNTSSEGSSEKRSSEALKHHKKLPPPRNSLLALIELLEPRAMLAGAGPESLSAAPLVTAPLGTGAISSSGSLLTCSSPTTGSSGTPSLSPTPTGSGGARSQPGSTGSTTFTLADAQSTMTLVPLVNSPAATTSRPWSAVWTGGDGGWQYFLTSDGEGSVDGNATEGEPLPLRWLGGTGYSQFRSMGGPGWGDNTPVFRPSDVQAAKRLTGLARMIVDHGIPVSVRAGDSNGRVMICTFADGTCYIEPVEPPSEQYIDSAAAVLAAAGVFRGGRALAIAESAESVANPISVVFKHGSRHLTGTSLNRLEVESVIAAHVRNLGVGAGASWGWVQVEGQWILYRLHILANTVRSVGTYFPVDGLLLPK